MSKPLLLDLKEKINLLIPETLWIGDTNDVSKITLSKSITNFLRIRIYFRDSNYQYSSSEAYNNGKTIERYMTLQTLFFRNSDQFLRYKGIRINDKTVEDVGHFRFSFLNVSRDYKDEIFINRIVGYKE